MLVTSRHTLAGLGARLVDVTVLGDEDAIALINEALRMARPDDERITGNRDAAAKLARICGGLPLALQITAALLKVDPALTAAELADDLAVESMRLKRLRYDDGSGAAGPSVAAAFSLSYRRLDETSARVFRLLPVNPGPDVSQATAAVLADMPATEVRGVLAGLAQAHLVEAAAGMGSRWRMHDLVRLYAQRLSDVHADADGREQARKRLLSYYLDTADAADDLLRDLLGTAVSAQFTGRREALAWFDAELPNLTAAVTLAARTGRDHLAIRLPLCLAEYLDLRRQFDDYLAVMTVSRDTARRLGDRGNEAMALNHLGIALRNLRRFGEAITTSQDAVAIFRETGDRHGEAAALNNLGNALREVGRFEEAITTIQDAVAIYRETGDRHGEGVALGNLGVAHRQAGQFDEALAAYDRALALDPSDTHAHTGRGVMLHDLGRHTDALAAHDRALGLDPSNGSAHNNRGITLLALGLYKDALAAYDRAIALDPSNGGRHEGKGIALAVIRQFDQALAELDTAVRLAPTGAGEGAIWAGAILWHQRDAAGARDRFALVEGRVTGSTPFRTAEMEAVALCGLNRPADAEQHLRDVMSLRAPGDLAEPRTIYDLLSDPPLHGIDRLRAIAGIDNAT